MQYLQGEDVFCKPPVAQRTNPQQTHLMQKGRLRFCTEAGLSLRESVEIIAHRCSVVLLDDLYNDGAEQRASKDIFHKVCLVQSAQNAQYKSCVKLPLQIPGGQAIIISYNE